MKNYIAFLAVIFLCGCNHDCYSEKYNEADFKVAYDICIKNNGIKYASFCAESSRKIACVEDKIQ